MLSPFRDATVFLWDANSERLRSVTETVTSVGAHPELIKDAMQV